MEKLTITFNVYDAGCLPGVLEHRLREAQRQKAASAGRLLPEQSEMIDAFISQMSNCLAAVNEARRVWASPGCICGALFPDDIHHSDCPSASVSDMTKDRKSKA